MERKQIELAVLMAKNFTIRAKALIKAQDEYEREFSATATGSSHPKESGALRRMSMDLTRQLAVMRKS